MNKIKVIGLTGPSGSGKSQFCEILKGYNIPCINSDKVAREIVLPDSKCLKLLTQRFGDILNDDGTLNRKALAKIAFSSKENTADLNKITHPFIMEKINKKIEVLQNKGEKIVVLEAPQLFESNADKLCDLIVCVIADRNLRERRIINRDNISLKEAKCRLNSALPDSFYIENSDIVIYNNDENTEQLHLKANQLLSKINNN